MKLCCDIRANLKRMVIPSMKNCGENIVVQNLIMWPTLPLRDLHLLPMMVEKYATFPGIP